MLNMLHNPIRENSKFYENFGSVENAGCGVRSAQCGVWRMRSVENAECGKK